MMMMSLPFEVLLKIRTRGIKVWAEGNNLRVSSASLLTEEEVEVFRKNKLQIIKELTESVRPEPEPVEPAEPLPGKIERIRQAVFVRLHAAIVEAWQRGEPTTDSERLGDAVDAIAWRVIRGEAEMPELETATTMWVKSFR